jgi:hypothetical protein
MNMNEKITEHFDGDDDDADHIPDDSPTSIARNDLFPSRDQCY